LGNARRVADHSQAYVAQWVSVRAGVLVGQSSISAYERGTIKKPSPAVREAIEAYCREAELTAALATPESHTDTDAEFQAIVASLTREPLTGDTQASLVRLLLRQLSSSKPLDPQQAAIVSMLAKFLRIGDLELPTADGVPARTGRGHSAAPLVAFFRGAGAALDAAADGGDPQTALRSIRQLHQHTRDALLEERLADAEAAE
jgi:hypothetical protein